MNADAGEQDRQHLKVLSITHYVLAGLTGLFACFPVIHLTLGISLLSGEFGDGPPDAFGWLFIIVAAVAILIGWAFAVALFLAGRFLVRRQHRLFCLVVAGVSCLFTPLGTVLGIFTILVLMRPSVVALFAETEADSQDQTAVAQPQTPAQRKQAEQRKRRRKRILLGAAVLLLFACLIGGGLIARTYNSRNAPPQVVWRHEAGGTVASAPLISDDVAYFGTLGEVSPAAFYAVDTATGQELWRTPASDAVFYWLPAVVDNKVFFASEDGYFLALDAHTGVEQWRFGPDQRRENLPQDPECRWCALKFRPPSVADGVIYVASHDEYLYALEARSGRERWRFHVGGLVWDAPVIVDGLVYVGSDDGHITVLDAASGALQQTTALGDDVSSLIIEGSLLYALVDDGLMALNRHTGREQWRTRPPWSLRGGFADRLHMDQERLYLMNRMQLIAVNKVDGSLAWQFARFHGDVFSEPAVAEGMVTVGDTDSYLYVFDGATGKLLRRISMVRHDPTSEQTFTAEFVFDAAVVDGIIYFGWYDYLYAVQTPGP